MSRKAEDFMVAWLLIEQRGASANDITRTGCLLLLGVLVILTSIMAPRALAQADCHSFARTDLERLYCELNAQSPGSVPGSLQEFRNNPPATQRLLLRRPAQRMGLTLPATPAAPPATRPSRPEPDKTKKSTIESTPKPPVQEPVRAPQSKGLGRCQLQGAAIRCNAQVYRLLTNRNNSGLAAGALDADNRLTFGNTPPQGSTDNWLQDSYVAYLDAMVSIGLAGETLSYTKFHHLYQEADAAGLSFTQRMSDMFEYLKKDKRTLTVRTGQADSLPQALTDCYRLNQRYIVCDNVRVNWIYQQQ